MADDRNLEIAKLAYSQALRGLDKQEAVHDSVLQRATANIAVLGITTAILAERFLGTSASVGYSIESLLAAICLGFSLIFSILAMKTKDDWVLHQSARKICKVHIEDNPDRPLDEVYASLAGYLEKNYASNENILAAHARRLNTSFIFTTIFVLLLGYSVIVDNEVNPMPTQQKEQQQVQQEEAQQQQNLQAGGDDDDPSVVITRDGDKIPLEK